MTGPAGAEAEARLAEFARHAVFDLGTPWPATSLTWTTPSPTATVSPSASATASKTNLETAAFLTRRAPEPTP
ncbi:hypothetical protein [Streptomyces phaeochromogenes]